ncbi:MAG: hypothetical protein JWQ11_3657 [Rhizobacter sp.]|nr:hypothetical protein [Rhizobacter sp.]
MQRPRSLHEDEPRALGGRAPRMTPEEIAATFRTPIRRHVWQDPRWLGAGALAVALVIGLGVFFFPRNVDESDWTPASTRGLVEQRGSTRNPQAILDGGPTGTPTRDPQAILNGEPTSAGSPEATATDTDVDAERGTTTRAGSREAASAAIDAVLSRPSKPAAAAAAAIEPAATAVLPAPSVADEPPAAIGQVAVPRPSLPAQNATAPTVDVAVPTPTPTPTPTSTTSSNSPAPANGACAANVQALGLCAAP